MCFTVLPSLLVIMTYCLLIIAVSKLNGGSMYRLNQADYFSHDDIISVQPRLPQEPFPEHSHDFHELVLIESGSAIHICNGVASHVSRGSVLYLKEDDCHCFEQMDSLCLTNVLFIPKEFESSPLLDILKQLCRRNDVQWVISECTQQTIKNILQRIHEETILDDPHSRLMTRSLLAQLAVILSRNSEGMMNGNEWDKLRALIHFIQEHYTSDLDWESLSDQYQIPLRTLNRKIKETTGLSPNAYLNRLRLCHASLLLTQSNQTITDIAFNSGFNDSNYFSTKFHHEFSVTPFQYRKRFE